MRSPENEIDTHWIRAFALQELEIGKARVLRHAGKQVAIFRTGAEQLFAVDNHCPHEGYPLAQGYVKGSLLTCAWHNFKFELTDGRCTKGDEDVRTWPVRVVDGDVEVDVAAAQSQAPVDPAPLYQSLEEGLVEYQLGRVARDVTRLLQAGVDAACIAACGARFDARRALYGTTHALPLATDVLRYSAWRDGLELTLPLVAALDMAADANVRRPERPRPAARAAASLGTPLAAARELAQLVENEDAAGAEALVRGAVQAGWRNELPGLLAAPLAQHHLSFGHPAIYTAKLTELLERTDWAGADELCGALVLGMVNATREDTLPPWRAFRERLDGLDDELELLWSRASESSSGTAVDWTPDDLFAALIGGSGREFFEQLAGALRAGVPLDTLCGVVAAAAAERIARFDVAIDANPRVQDGWLFVTHTLTHAAAVRTLLRQAVARGRDAETRLLRLLFFAARFVHGGRALDRPEAGPPSPPTRPAPAAPGVPPTPEELLDAIRGGDPDGAAALAAGWIERNLPLEPLERAWAELALDAGLVRPILIAHAVKTTFAAFDEVRALSSAPLTQRYRALPLVALARFFASPKVERTLVRSAHEAVRFVGHGEVPTVLSD